MSIKTRLLAGAGVLALAGGTLVAAAPVAHADVTLGQNLIGCSGQVTISSLNPTLGSGDAHYVKTALKRSDGSVHSSLTGAEDLGPAPTDATTCLVDSGITTNNTSTDVGTKTNPYDNQTNGQGLLNMTSGPFATSAKVSGAIAGSASCNRVDPGLTVDYPQSYPLNGKVIWKFGQADAAAKQIQMQQFVRLGTDPADSDVTHITITGIVIKGPGVGGTANAVAAFGASFSTKNVGLLDCVANPAAGTASLAQLIIQAADGSDADGVADNWVVSIPS